MMIARDDRKRERCQTCGFKIRGKNHDEGPHHQAHAKDLRSGNVRVGTYTPPKFGYSFGR